MEAFISRTILCCSSSIIKVLQLGFVLLAVTHLTLKVRAQECLQPEDIPFEDLGERDDSGRLPSGSQAIVTSYQFQCCGNVTEWQTHVEPGGGGHDGAYSIHFQVWRPSPTVQDDGCYSLVGEDRFSNIRLTNGGLISRTLQPTNMIPARPGDVVGYFTRRRDKNSGDILNGRTEGIQLDEDDSANQETVWYLPNIDPVPTGSCPFPVGNGGTLRSFTTARPVLSVSITSYNCPSTNPPRPVPTTSTPQPVVPIQTPTPEVTIQTPESGVTEPVEPVQPPEAVVPTQTPPPMIPINTPALAVTVNTPPQLEATTKEPPFLPASNPVNAGLAAGLVIVILVLIISAIVIASVFLLKKSRKAKSQDVGVLNPNYAYSQASSINKDSTADVKLSSHVPSPAGTDDNMYSSIDYSDFNPRVDFSDDTCHYYSLAEKKGEPHRIQGLSKGPEVKGKPPPLPPSAKTVSPRASGAGKAKPPPLPPSSKRGKPNATGAVSPSSDHTYSMLESENTLKNDYHLLGSEYSDPNVGDGVYADPISETSILEQDETGDVYTDPKTERYNLDSTARGSAGLVVPNQAERKRVLEKKPTYNKLNFFVDEHIYWTPGATTAEIYDQLSSKKYREISKKQLTILEHLGSGQFGTVSKGLWSVSGDSILIAVKQLLLNVSSMERVKLLQEAAIMGQFSHPNVVKLYGLVTLKDPLMICLEFMSNGDLKSYINTMDLSKVILEIHSVPSFFLRASKEVAAGMRYLSRKCFVHRDLAARNILLDDSLTCKIGDFGMARDLMDDTYYTSQGGGKIPIKWTAPEALLYKKYSSDSDVWSYAMLLFEIWSVAKKPFSSLTNSEVLRVIQKGYCQPPPPGCPRAIYRLMVDCWNPQHQYRPKFGEICNYLQQPVSKLLYCSPTDSPSMEVLGGPLESAHQLYPELQDKYKNSKKS